MKVNVLAFGIAKDIFGGSAIALDVPGNTTSDLKAVLERQFPRLKQLRSYLIAVNNEYAREDHLITEKDEIAIIPPVSGG
jgi:molybdopterin converting factor subunit 1